MQWLTTTTPKSFLPAEREQVREAIETLQATIEAGCESGELTAPLHDGGTDEGSAECMHHFGDGVYVRSLWIPKDTVLVGRLHKQARVCVIAAGRCRFVDERRAETVEAPWVGEFKAGSKTAVYAEEDTLWIACVGTDLKDPQTAFYELTAASHAELLLEHT